MSYNGKPKIWIPGQGPRLKQFRNAVGLSQEAVAEVIDCSWMTVLRWEYGDTHENLRAVPFEVMKKLATLYKVTMAELLPGFNDWAESRLA